MSEARSYAKPLELGDVVTSQAAGEVVESNDPRFSPGDKVVGQLGWQEYAVARGGSLRPVDLGVVPLQAYCTCSERPASPRTSGSSTSGGPVRATRSSSPARPARSARSSASSRRSRAAAPSGSPAGRRRPTDLRELFRYDAAIDYKNEDVGARLREACPDGVDVYFDNVGGEISAAVHRRLAIGSRIVICGQVSTVQRRRPAGTRIRPAPADRLPRADGGVPGQRLCPSLRRGGAAPRPLAADGTLQYKEDVTEGLENAPQGLHRHAARRKPREGAREGGGQLARQDV